MQGAYPTKKKSFAGQFVAVRYRSETYCWTQKLNLFSMPLQEEDVGRVGNKRSTQHTPHSRTGATAVPHLARVVLLPARVGILYITSKAH